MSPPLALAELTRTEIAEIAGDAILVIPFGAVEQHGPQLPFGTDVLIVEAVARAAVETCAAEPVAVAPTFAYGSSHHHLDVGGALSLAWQTFAACAADLLRSAAASGFRRVFVVNGHGGNDEPLHAAAQTVAREERLVVGGGSYWNLAAAQLGGAAAPVVPGHAGRFEAALVRALRSDLHLTPAAVSKPQPPAERRYWLEHAGRWTHIDGYSDDPDGATAAEGAAYLEQIGAGVATCIDDFDASSASLVRS